VEAIKMNCCPVTLGGQIKWHSVPVRQKSSGAVAIQVGSAPALRHSERQLRPFWLPTPVTSELAEFH